MLFANQTSEIGGEAFAAFTSPDDLLARIPHHQGMDQNVLRDYCPGTDKPIPTDGVSHTIVQLAPNVAPCLTSVARTWSILRISALGL